MSSVGSSDSSDRNDKVIRRNREEYRNNESDLVKRHQKELRRINEQHYQEVENLKQAHNRQMNELKERSHDSISARDHRYQQDMEEMRSLYRRQLQQLSEESTQKQDALRKSVTGDSDHVKLQSENRLAKLHEEYAQKLNDREQQFRRSLEETREDSKASIDSNREKLKQAHAIETKVIRDERNQSVGHLQNELATYRTEAEQQRREQEVRHMKEKHRGSENLLRAVGRERTLRVEGEEVLRDGFKDGLTTMRERYEKAMHKERHANQISADHLKTTAGQRVDEHVRRLENENQDLRDAKIRNEIQNKAKTQREIKNMREAFTKNMEVAQFERDETIRAANQDRRQALGEQHDKMSDEMVAMNRQNLERMNQNNRINRRALTNMKGDFESRVDQTKSLADRRVERIFEETEATKAQLAKLHKDTHAAQQRQKADDIKQIRDLMDDDKNAAVNRMQDMIRKQEIKHADQMSQVVDKYEKQVRDLKDQMVSQRRAHEETVKRTVEDMQRANKMAIDTLESQNRDRMRQVNLQQSEQLRTLNKRHEEKLDQVISEVKKT